MIIIYMYNKCVCVQLIANDCYKMGHFFYSLKAFDVLERLDPNPEYWEGKRGACVGAFQKIVAGKEPRDSLREITQMLRNTQNPQVEYIMRTFKVVFESRVLLFFCCCLVCLVHVVLASRVHYAHF